MDRGCDMMPFVVFGYFSQLIKSDSSYGEGGSTPCYPYKALVMSIYVDVGVGDE